MGIVLKITQNIKPKQYFNKIKVFEIQKLESKKLKKHIIRVKKHDIKKARNEFLIIDMIGFK